LHGVARGRRLIVTDARGFGCSDRGTPRDVPPLEGVMEDVAIVLEAARSERAVILATEELAFVACMFAATYPDRTTAAILYDASPTLLWSEETPWEHAEERFDEEAERFKHLIGTRAGAEYDVRETNPSMTDNADYIAWWHRYCLLSQAPGAAVAAGQRYKHTDIRPILPTIHVPVLVLVRPDQPDTTRVEAARYLVDHIAGGKLQELPGRDGDLWIGEQESVFRAIDTFLAEVGRERAALERVLATVLFTDVIDSTATAAEVGDRRWRGLVEAHHATVRALLERYRGTEVDTAGDGFFATFEGPARAVRCAQAIIESVHPLGIEVRAGIHVGEVETIAGKAGGIAVSIGARIGAAADRSEILVSRTVKDLTAGSGLRFEDAGEHELKGVPDTWRLYRVVTA